MSFLNPKNAEQGKGFLEGRTFKVTDAAWVIHDGQGNWDRESTCYYMELTDTEGKLNDPVDQYYSIGTPSDFIPQDKGKSLKNKKAMNVRCNFYHFAVSLINAGVPEEVVEGLEKDATGLVGLVFRMGTTMRHKKDKNGLPTPDEVFEVPGENDPEAKAKQVIADILADNGGQVAIKKSLPNKLTVALADLEEEEAKAIRKIALNAKFLKENFTVDGNTVAA